MTSALNRRAWLLMITGLVLIPVGVIAAFQVRAKWQRVGALARGPQRMRLADLIANGPGDNPHVIVTDFTCGKDFVYLSQQQQDLLSRREVAWGMVWIPLYPREANGPPSEPRAFRALLATPHVHDRAVDVQILNRRERIDALVGRAADGGLDPDVRDKLRRSYPDTDFSDCLLIEEIDTHAVELARTEAYLFSAAAAGGTVVGGVCFLVGLYLWNLDRKRGSAQPPGPGPAAGP